MKRKLLIVLLSLVCTLCLAFGLSACDLFDSSSGTTDNDTNNEQTDNTDDDSSGSGSSNGDNTDDGGTDGGEQDSGETTHTHTAGEAVTENIIEATCIADGSYESVIYCSYCGEELSCEIVTVAATGVHIYGEDGKCTVCGVIKISEGLEYTISNDGESYTVSGIGVCTDTNVIIPSTYEGLPVTSIGGFAFQNCVSFTKVTIPDSVTSISNYAFSSCTSLTSVTIPDSVTSIGNYAYYSCSLLASITIGSGVTSIGSGAFRGCSMLTEINFKATAMDDSSSNFVFYNAGQESDGITVTIGANVTKIPAYLFYQSNIISVAFEDNCLCETIGDYAFYKCTSLTSITIPDSVTYIGSDAFYCCYSLTSVTIGSGITSIGGYAFNSCYKLIEVYNLSSLTIDAGSTNNGYVGYYAKNIYTATSGESYLTAQNDYIYYNDNGTYYLIGYTGNETDITLPENIKGNNYSLYKCIFFYCTSLTSITIPNSVTSIGTNAFYYCTSLTSITIPNSVTSIGGSAFSDCSSLTSVTLGSGVKTIYSFTFYNCTSLTNIIIPDRVTFIGDYAFQNCASLTNITIPDRVTSIGDYAFQNCASLTNITIPDRVTSVGISTFADCTSLASVTLGSGITSIHGWAFSGCISLKSITIPNSVTSIHDGAFYGCTSLASVIIPNGVTSIGGWAFCLCTSLESVTFENISGWYVSTSSTATSGTDIASDDLEITSTAAKYLRSTYFSYYWYRSDD